MTLRELRAELDRIEGSWYAGKPGDGCEVRVQIIDWADGGEPIEVGVDRIELIAGWRLVIYPDPAPR